MKKIGKIFLSFTLIFSFGCSTGMPDSAVPVLFELIGEWRMNSYNYAGNKTVIDGEDVVHSQFTGIGFELHMDMNFTDNPNEYNYVGDYKVDHIVIADDGSETLYFGQFDVNDLGTWEKNGSSIILTLNGEPKQGTITVLTENVLEFNVNHSSSTTHWSTDVITNISRTDFYRFLKQ